MNVEGINRIPEKYYTQISCRMEFFWVCRLNLTYSCKYSAAYGARIVIFNFILFNSGASGHRPRGRHGISCANYTGYFLKLI